MVVRLLGISLLVLMGCDKRTQRTSTSPPGASAAEEPSAGTPAEEEVTGRPLFVDAPALRQALTLGEVTRISESWAQLPDDSRMNHCFAAFVQINDIPTTGAEFNAIVEGLGHRAEVTNEAITVEKPDLLIALMLVAEDRAIINGCWKHDTAPARVFEDLTPDEPPLSRAAEIASGVGGLRHVTLEWDAQRGVSVRAQGSIAEGEAEAAAAWFSEHDFGPVEPTGDLAQRDLGDGLTSFVAVHADPDPHWIVELNLSDAPSPFAS